MFSTKTKNLKNKKINNIYIQKIKFGCFLYQKPIPFLEKICLLVKYFIDEFFSVAVCTDYAKNCTENENKNEFPKPPHHDTQSWVTPVQAEFNERWIYEAHIGETERTQLKVKFHWIKIIY